jgi:hypothetical protein
LIKNPELGEVEISSIVDTEKAKYSPKTAL